MMQGDCLSSTYSLRKQALPQAKVRTLLVLLFHLWVCQKKCHRCLYSVCLPAELHSIIKQGMSAHNPCTMRSQMRQRFSDL